MGLSEFHPFSCLICSLCTNQAVSVSLSLPPFYHSPHGSTDGVKCFLDSRLPSLSSSWPPIPLVPPLFAFMCCSLHSFTLGECVRGHANICSSDKNMFRIALWLQDDCVSTSLSSIDFGQNYDDFCQNSIFVCRCVWRRHLVVMRSVFEINFKIAVYMWKPLQMGEPIIRNLISNA